VTVPSAIALVNSALLMASLLSVSMRLKPALTGPDGGDVGAVVGGDVGAVVGGDVGAVVGADVGAVVGADVGGRDGLFLFEDGELITPAASALSNSSRLMISLLSVSMRSKSVLVPELLFFLIAAFPSPGDLIVRHARQFEPSAFQSWRYLHSALPSHFACATARVPYHVFAEPQKPVPAAHRQSKPALSPLGSSE